MQRLKAYKMTPEERLKLMQQKSMFLEEMSGMMLQRRLCVTEQGFLGVVSQSAKVGDQLFILKGGRVPFVLRDDASTQSQARFRFVGECYVHGVMNGEVMERQNFEWEEVSLY